MTERPGFADGIGVERISFSGGRLAADLVRHGGLTRIIYYGNQRGGDAEFFHAEAISAWQELFRPVVRLGGKRYALEFHDTTIYPTGYTSYCESAGIRVRHELIVANQELCFNLEVLSGNPAGLEFELINTDICTRRDKPTRCWDKVENAFPLWRVTDRYPEAEVAAEQKSGYLTLAQRGDRFVAPAPHSETHFGIIGTSEIAFRETPWIFRKHYYAQKLNGNRASFILGFGHAGEAELVERLKHAPSCFSFPDGANSPRFRSGDPVLDSFMDNAPDILDSFAVKDLPGAYRAADSGYWVWGWDGMVWAEAFGLLNRTGAMFDVLDFYRRTADPESGIFHEMHPDQRPYKSMAFPAQCLYAVLLYQAFIYSGDEAKTREYLPFAEEIVRRAGLLEVEQSGLIRGVALYPDHPEDLDQDGDDLSVFNNGIYYQALRALEELNRKLGMQTANYQSLAERTRNNFDRFFDAETGCFYDSLSAKDFSPRRHYPVYALLYVTPFAGELLTGKLPAAAHAAKEHFAMRQGCRILSWKDTAYMLDGNQLGMYMPSTERYYRELCHFLDPAANRAKFRADLGWNWKKLTLPEALTCEYENHGFTPDNPGRKQFFTLKPWASNAYRFLLGIECTLDGIAFGDSAEPGSTTENLRWRGKTLAIRNTGGAGPVTRLTLNGTEQTNLEMIRWEQLANDNNITVERL